MFAFGTATRNGAAGNKGDCWCYTTSLSPSMYGAGACARANGAKKVLQALPNRWSTRGRFPSGHPLPRQQGVFTDVLAPE